jgi:hypothetical protein
MPLLVYKHFLCNSNLNGFNVLNPDVRFYEVTSLNFFVFLVLSQLNPKED